MSLGAAVWRDAVLLNRGGGTAGRRSRDRRRGRARRSSAPGLDAEVELIDGGECAVRCRAIAKRGDPLLVVGGGDGTISAAASALVGTKTRLGIMPLGTLNHFARDLGIPTELEEAAKLIAKGKDRRVDVAEMNGRIFINNSAIGLYPLMVRRPRDAAEEARPQQTAGDDGRVVAHARPLQAPASDPDGQRGEDGRIDTPLLFVGNNDYRLDIGAPGERESVDDGRLSVFVMRKKTRRGLIAASIRALFDRSRKDDMVTLDNVERLRVSSKRSLLPVSLDGEVVRAKPPLDYKIRKKALRVIAP